MLEIRWTQIVCRNTFEVGMDPVLYAANEAKSMTGNAKDNFRKMFGEKRRWDRESRSLSNPGFRMLEKIKLDLHKEIKALNARWDILEHTGNPDNLGL